MKRGIKLLSSAVLGLAAVACSSPEKMADMAENVSVKCDPAVLEVVAGNIDATVTVTYPADYFHPKAILEVTPVIVYEGGEAAMEPFVYQGEKVTDNYKVIPSDGSTVTEKVHFSYVPGMEKSYLELRGVVKYKNKSVNLPVKKAADGANTTYMLVNKDGKLDFRADNYQEIIKQTAEGQILYTINSSTVRNSQLKSESIKSFQAALDEIKGNERKELVSTDIVAYASPDGKQDLNAKLSDRRSSSAERAFGKVTKGHEVEAPVNVKSIGEDWEGFQELVSQSDIEDKDLIIRGGENLSAGKIERAILSVEGVGQAVVVAVKDEKWGEVPCAAVTLRRGAALTAEEISAALVGRLSKHECPARIAVLRELPLTSSGKPDKLYLKEYFARS